MVEPPAEPLTVSPAPAEARAPDEESTASRSHFRRWYLRPWVLLLLAILLPLGTFCWRIGMRYRAMTLLEPFNQNPWYIHNSLTDAFGERFPSIPEVYYCDVCRFILEIPDEPATQQMILDQLRWFPELLMLDLSTHQKQSPSASVPITPNMPPLRLPALPRLRVLQASRVSLSAESFSVLRTSPKFYFLALSDSPLSGSAVAEISQLRSLTSLHIARCRLTDDMLPELSQLCALKSLTLHGEGLSDRGLAVLSNYHQLTALRISGAKLGRQSMAAIRQLPLEQLTLSQVDLDDELLALLSPEISNLQKLHLHSNGLTNRSLAAVALHQSLESVSISSSHVTLDGIAPLRKLKRLSSLSINDCQLELPIGPVPVCVETGK